MTKELLKKAFELMNELNEAVDTYEAVKFNVTETPLFNTAGCLFDILIETNYTEEGQDIINEWYFDQGCDWSTFDELYDKVEAHKK